MPRIIIHVDDPTGRAAAQPVFLNGKATPIQINTAFDVPDDVLLVLQDSTLKVELLPAEGVETSPGPAAADAGAASGPGGDTGGAAAFDAEAVIVGKIADIEASLGTLTAAQLAAVRAAEIDREKPRKGVLELLDKAEVALAETPPDPEPAPLPDELANQE